MLFWSSLATWLVATLVLLPLLSSPVVATERVASGSQALYTVEQAERGKAAYALACAECHSADLSGGEGPALKGQAFLRKWNREGLFRLLQKLRDDMPLFVPETLSTGTKADVLAYMLQANAYPPGPRELPADLETLASLRWTLPDAQAP